MAGNTLFVKDPEEKKMTITRSFAFPVRNVWQCWTEIKLLAEWWAPEPYKVKTKHYDFTEGGQWMYAMVGPENEAHWGLVNYKEIKDGISFTATDFFCDENGTINKELPSTEWEHYFNETEDGTEVEIILKFATEADLNTMLEMGFEEGFTAGLNNLEALLASQ